MNYLGSKNLATNIMLLWQRYCMSGYANFFITSYYLIAITCFTFLSLVRHSQHANEPLLQVWVICEDDGAIESAHCTCMAGLGVYIYCYCKQGKGGEMIGYDNKECQHGQWFHLLCLKMKRTPRASKWYCPNCQKLTQFKRKRQRKV